MFGQIYEDFFIYISIHFAYQIIILCLYEPRTSCFSFHLFCHLKPGIKGIYEVFVNNLVFK